MIRKVDLKIFKSPRSTQYDWSRLMERALAVFQEQHSQEGIIRDAMTKMAHPRDTCCMCGHPFEAYSHYPSIGVSNDPALREGYVSVVYVCCDDQSACDDRRSAREFRKAVRT